MQMSQIVDFLSTAQPNLDSSSPAPRRLSQGFSPNLGDASIPTTGSSPTTITVMSTKMSESSPILKVLDLYDLILYTRSYLDWTTLLGAHTTPAPFASVFHGDVIESICDERDPLGGFQALAHLSDVLDRLKTYIIHCSPK